MSLKSWFLDNLRHQDAPVTAQPEPEPYEGRKTALTPDGYPIVQFAPDITNVLRFDGIGFNYAQIYASQQNVRTVIDYVARNAAGLRCKMYEKISRGDGKPSDRLELTDHDLAILLEDPTPGESRFDFYYAAFADFCIYDENKFLMIRDRPGAPPRALVRIPPPNLIPVRDNITNRVIGWNNTSGVRVPFEDVLWFTGYDPNTSQSAVPPMETLRRLLAEEYARDRAQEAFWRRGLRKEGVIERDKDAPKMSDEARESFLIDAEDALAGSTNGYRPFMMEPGMKWVDTSWRPNDTAYIMARRVSRQEACAMWHVPPALVAAAENGSQPDEASMKVFHTSTLPPYLERFEANVKAKLIPQFTPSPKVRRNQYVRFNLDEKLRGSFEEKAQIMATVVGGPVASVNEGRARLDLPKTDNPADDQIYVPLNSFRGGGPQASPQNPVETPATDAGNPEPPGTSPTPRGASYEFTSDPEPDDLLGYLKGWQQKMEDRAAGEVLRARVEERASAVVVNHLKRQAAAPGKQYDSERWTRELVDDLVAGLMPILGVEQTGELKSRLQRLAESVNAETEALRDDPYAFDSNRAQGIAESVVQVLDRRER